MKNDPPPNERISPESRPPPVCVFMAIWSFIQAIVLVWLYTVSPGARSIATVCMIVPEI